VSDKAGSGEQVRGKAVEPWEDAVAAAARRGDSVAAGRLLDAQFPNGSPEWITAAKAIKKRVAAEPIWSQPKADYVARMGAEAARGAPSQMAGYEASESAKRKASDAYDAAIEKAYLAGEKTVEKPIWAQTGIEWSGHPDGPGPMAHFHKSAVTQAVRSGKPVPAEVLADYPDLAAAHPEAAKFTGTAANGVRYVDGVPQKGEESGPSTANAVDTNRERGSIPGQGAQPATPNPEAKPMTATKVRRTSTSGQGDISGDLLHTDTLTMPNKGQAVEAKIEIVKLDSPVNGLGYAMVADAAGQTRWRLFKSEDDARAELAKSKEQSAKQFGGAK